MKGTNSRENPDSKTRIVDGYEIALVQVIVHSHNPSYLVFLQQENGNLMIPLHLLRYEMENNFLIDHDMSVTRSLQQDLHLSATSL